MKGNNRNILECKLSSLRLASFGLIEIIETYWNVNNVVENIKFLRGLEIIETYWNVNFFEYWYNLNDCE